MITVFSILSLLKMHKVKAFLFKLTARYSSPVCALAEFIRKLWPPQTKHNSTRSQKRDVGKVTSRSKIAFLLYLFIRGHSIWACNCPDQHYRMFTPHISRLYNPSLSSQCLTNLLLHLSKPAMTVKLVTVEVLHRTTRLLDSGML